MAVDVKDLGYAAAGAGVATAAVLYLAIKSKIADYKKRVKAIEQAVSSGHGTSIDAVIFGTRIRATENEIKAAVEAEISRVAAASALDYMSRVYGITPERITAITGLAHRLGV